MLINKPCEAQKMTKDRNLYYSIICIIIDNNDCILMLASKVKCKITQIIKTIDNQLWGTQWNYTCYNV